jgi:hypothetical protein
MPDLKPGRNQEVWIATVLLALFSSALCALGGLIYVLAQWNNPIWDIKVKAIFLIGVVMFAGLAVLLSFLYHKRSR